MVSRRSVEEKVKLIVANSRTKRLPAFVMVRTKRKVRDNPVRRSWRRGKIKMTSLLGKQSIQSRRKLKSQGK